VRQHLRLAAPVRLAIDRAAQRLHPAAQQPDRAAERLPRAAVGPAQPVTDRDARADTIADGGAHAGADPIAHARPYGDTRADLIAHARTHAEPDPGSDTEPDTVAHPEPDTRADPDADRVADADREPEPDPGADGVRVAIGVPIGLGVRVADPELGGAVSSVAIRRPQRTQRDVVVTIDRRHHPDRPDRRHRRRVAGLCLDQPAARDSDRWPGDTPTAGHAGAAGRR